MMGYSKLCLLLLLSTYTLAQNDGERASSCLLASRFKAYKKYVYQYATEGRNGVVGASNLRNGPKVSCQVEIEVPQTCRFIMHTRDCALSEMVLMDPQGRPVYRQMRGSGAFQAAMQKNPLKFSVEEVARVQLYPEADEPVNILNIKRGIVSSLMVPAMDDEGKSVSSTVHGQCLTDYVVNDMKDVAPDVTLSRDLSKCDQFHSRELVSSPLALLQKLHRPMSKLISSTQDCSYQFDNKGKHITTGLCTEKHVYLPFSHAGNGISSVVTQELIFQSSKRTNIGVFDVNPNHSKPLHFEDPDDKAPVQTTDAVLNALRDLAGLAGTDQGQKRTSLFHKLVQSLRVLGNETLSRAVPEMLETSQWLAWQALLQCGSSECTSAILQAVRTVNGKSLEVDALVYALSLKANPDAALVRDMLSMAQYKQSRAIMYALANTVKKFHKGKVTSVVTDVSRFMETLLNDCSVERLHADILPEETSFLVLRVVGVMGEAMQAVSPSLISSVLRCAKKTDIPLSNQKAALQALRLMKINDEIKQVLSEVYMDHESPIEKRVAAYLMLMRDPDRDLMRDIVTNLENVKDEQLNSFVVSHLNNIYHSNEPQTQKLRVYIEAALKGRLPPTDSAHRYDGTSRNYKVDSPFGSIQTNVICNGSTPVPKEIVMKTTLKAFDYNNDIFEVGVEGSGFEPILEAFFGMNGFVTEIFSRVMQAWYSMPHNSYARMKRQGPQDFVKDIPDIVKKLINDLQLSPSPEATAYLQLLGNEIGYLKMSDKRKMADTLSTYYNTFIKVLPMKVLHALTSSTENELFAHYIFMDNAFSLPTASGFPLKFSFAGVFALGTKGGLSHSVHKGMADLSFMPSAGLEFITHMGVHIPDYVEAGLEMHTNIYHESALKTKANMKRNQVKLSIPAPKSNTQLLSISNKVLSVSSGETKLVPSLVEDRRDSTDCQPLFKGLKLCTSVRYSNATSIGNAPYYPLTGESRLALEINPTGEVSEYTATIADETIREGKKGRHKIESLKLTLKAEGVDSAEASASLKYNRNKNTFTTEVVIPDFEVEAGIKLSATDSDAKGKKMHGVTIDITNRNIPQLTLVGKTRLEGMKDAMVQLQMAIPALRTSASVTTNLRTNEDVIMEFETDVKLHETSYKHKSSLKYDNDKIELEFKSDLNSEIQKMIPQLEHHHRQLQQLIDSTLDQRVTKTDMKLRHIVTKGIEAGNIWLDKLTAHIPYLATLRRKRSISDLTLPALPEKLFLQSDMLLRYEFNKNKMAIALRLPMGGKRSDELNFPATLSIPQINIPEVGLHIPAKNYPLPSFTIPPSLDLMVPLLGLAEASFKINSNVYKWEGSISGGNSTVDVPSYIAQYKVISQSPVDLLSYKLEGTGMMSGRADDNLKYVVNSSLSHSLIQTSFSILETLRVTDKLKANANYRIEASSPLGMRASAYYSGQATSTLNSDQVSGDGSVDGLLKIGSFYTNTSYTHSYNLRPLDKEGRGESTLQFTSPYIQIHNMIHGVYANSELKIVSKTNAQKNALRHVAELKYKDAQVTLKCTSAAKAMGKSLNNNIEIGVSRHLAILRFESQVDDDTNRAYSLLSGSLDSNGLELNSEGSLMFEIGRGFHKAAVKVGRSGLVTSGTNSVQCSPVMVENTFKGAIDTNGANMSSMTKVMGEESRGELNIEGKVTSTEASLDGVLKGDIYDASTRNNLNIVLDRRALKFTSNSMGTLRRVKTENSHVLTLTLWTLALHSKSNSYICEDVYYKQDTKVGLRPFLMSLDMTNDAKFYEIGLKNEARMKLQPSKMDLSGSVKGAYGEKHNIKHVYEITYNDLAGSMKYSMSGLIMDVQLNHSCKLEFAGFSSKSNCQARIHSEPLRLESTLNIMALPFSLFVDGFVASDGEINVYGKHTGELYSKILAKAEPLAFAYSHNSRVATKHKVQNAETSTSLDNNWDGLLTPSDQSLTWTLKSKLNNHAYNQDMRAYNNPEKIGLEFSGAMLTDTFSRLGKRKRSLPETEEFNMAGFLKYDKNSDCHIIQIPYIQNFPAGFNQLKNHVLQALESLQQFINNLDVNQLIANFRATLDRLPTQVRAIMQKMDLENKVRRVKAQLDYLIKEFAVSMKDLELISSKLLKNLEKNVITSATNIRSLLLNVEDYIKRGHLADNITSALAQVGDQLQAFDEKYAIRQSLVRILYATEDVIRQIDLQKLNESTAAWLRELDSKYKILEIIKEKLSEMKQAVENFDVNMLFQEVRDYLVSVDFATYVEQLAYKIPSSEIASVIESMNDVIINWIDEYEIPNKLNAVYFYIRDLLVKYNIDAKFKDLMDQTVILIREFKIEETVQTMVTALKSIKFEVAYDKMMQFLLSITDHLRAIDFKKYIDDFNEQISKMLRLIKEFDYSAFVDETNIKIAELTNSINEQIQLYELVQKFEAMREFIREIQNSIFAYLEGLKDTKVADALKKLKKVIDTTFYNDVKLKVQDILEDVRQRILDMDIREEIYIYLQRASESYSNIVTFVSAQFNQLIGKITEIMKDNKFIAQTNQFVNGVLSLFRKAEIKVDPFTVPFTDLVIPAFTVNLNKLQEIRIPAQIFVPEFTILNSYTIPAVTIDFEELKTKMVALIDRLREFQIQTPDPEEIFGDLKLLYLFTLPDLTLPEITLSEIKIPPLHIPKLNMTDFQIPVLPIPEIILSKVPSDICIPVFGKLHGEFKFNSPQVTLVTSGKLENATSTPKNPQFIASITSYAKSPIEPLKYTFEASAQLEAPRMKKLIFTQKVKATHKTFSIDHQGLLTLSGSSAEASLMTTTKATTQMYTADLDNKIALSLTSGISAAINTMYSHNVDIPSMNFLNQATLKQNIKATMELDKIAMTSETTGTGKLAIQDYDDEGTHRSKMEVSIDFNTAKVTFEGETHSKALKLKQTMTAESAVMSHFTLKARCETEMPSVKKSVLVLNGEANIGDVKVALRASHDAELTGALSGSMANVFEFVAEPFGIVLEVTNKVNSKISLPLKLTGKVDLLYDYGVILNSEKQRTYWISLARFNQYKYKHNMTAENNNMEIVFISSVNGEANLDFLTVPLSTPEITIPYFQVTIPEIRDISLWEDARLKNVLSVPQQSFDLNIKLHYSKNPDKHSFELDLEPLYGAISDNAHIIQAQFEQYRDKVVKFLKDSQTRAKAHYDKHKINTSGTPPRFLTVPGYKIPILDIEVSGFRAEMPAFSYTIPKEFRTPSFRVPALGFSVPSYTLVLPSLEIPVIHVPESLGEIRLPTFTLPSDQNNVVFPAMGNITWDFSFKSTVVALSANAGLYNQSDVVARFGASSTSVFEVLNGKMDVTTSLTHKRGIKVATAVSLEHSNVKANHEFSINFIKGIVEASVANSAKLILPFLYLELNQELTGNTKTKPNVASVKKMKYTFNIPSIESVGKGDIDVNWALEGLSSYVSMETSTQGKSDLTILGHYNVAGDLKNDASFYLNANGLRSAVRTALNSDITHQEKLKRSLGNILHFDLNKNLVLEVSLRRMLATVNYTSNNNLAFASFTTNGRHHVKGELYSVPLRSFAMTLNFDASQPSSLGPANAIHNINLAIESEKQVFMWSSNKQLSSLIEAWDLLLSNDESEIRMDLTGSVEGHVAFLKSVRLPVYQKTLWDVLKFDQVTNMDNTQFLNITFNILYTKAMDGLEYKIPTNIFENGVTFSLPETSIDMPSWVGKIPQSLRNLNMQFENTTLPDHVTLPPVISVPAFNVPFTNLHVEPFMFDPKDLNIPKLIRTKAFEILLPGLPVISVPSYNINTDYLQGKVSFLSFKMPQYEIRVSSFTLPKSLSIAGHMFNLSEITSQISNFEIPTIVIPEQVIEVPEMSLHLPSSVFIPVFGTLSATFKVSSPIHNVSTTANLEKKESSLITSLNSICTSTMSFLEYTFTGSANVGFDNGVINLNGKCNLIHNDVNVDWQHVWTQNLRIKRQTPGTDLMHYRHTLSVDITSRTFADVSFRLASRKDGITASMSSPASGFLGFHFQRRSPSQLYGKLFSRYLSAPDKDVDVFTAKATLRNSQRLLVQTSWNWDFLQDVFEGTKERIPAMSNAVFNFINKYHTAHFGFDLNRGGMKLKNAISNLKDRVYNSILTWIDVLQNSIKHLVDSIKGYMKTSHALMSMSVPELADRLNNNATRVLQLGKDKMHVLLNVVKEFLSETKFTVPGAKEKLSSLEMLQLTFWSASIGIDKALKTFVSTTNMFSDYTGIQFTVPRTKTVFRENEIVNDLKSQYDRLAHSLLRSFELLQKKVNDFFQTLPEKAENVLAILKDENVRSDDVLRSSKRFTDEAKRHVTEYKDLTKQKIQEAYSSFTVARVTNSAKDAISVFQSHFYTGLNQTVELMRRSSQATAPYIRVSNKKMDVEVPLPFHWKSFTEWPMRHKP